MAEARGSVLPDGEGIKAGGWAIKCSKGPITGRHGDGAGLWIVSTQGGRFSSITMTTTPFSLCNAADAAVEAMKEAHGCMGWPEQYFGDNRLLLEHEASGTSIEFCAADALEREPLACL